MTPSNGIKSAVRDALRQAAVSGNSQSVNAKTEDASKTEDNTTVKGNFPYKEGIYYGTAEGYNGEIEVAVVLQDKSIKAVLVTKNHDDEKFFNRAMDVVKNIMKKQSTDVDVVSGATYSSNGLINAVKNALKEAEKVTNGQTTGTTGTNGTSGKSGKTGSTSNTKSGKAAKTGDPSGMFAWLGLAVTSLGAGIGGFSLKRKKREDEE